MDNNLFRVNGPLKIQDGFDFLEATVELIMRQQGYRPDNRKGPNGWSFCKEKGLVFYWHRPSFEIMGQYHALGGVLPGQTVPKPATPEETARMIRNWFDSGQHKDVQLDPWCEDIDQDGHNSLGFVIYVDDWGKVGDDDYAFFAVKPCYLWHGK